MEGAARATSPVLAAAATAALEAAPPAVASFCRRHFGGEAEAVPFERLWGAAEAALGAPLTSVDMQLLRLELMDERGRLSLAALARLHSQRATASGEEAGGEEAGGEEAGGEEAGGAEVGGESGDGSEDVGASLRGLLTSARAQLELQVAARMRQAAHARPGGGPNASSPTRGRRSAGRPR